MEAILYRAKTGKIIMKTYERNTCIQVNENIGFST